MKVYFTASIVGKKHFLSAYRSVVSALEASGAEVQSDHIFHTTEEDIRLETKQEREAYHRQLHAWISSAHCMVVEASFPSISVGYEISLALHYKKPVLVLYGEGDPPSLFTEHLEEKIVCEHYTEETITTIVSDFLSYIQDTSDARFTFFLSPKLAQYLDQRSSETAQPKSAYLRDLIEQDMHNHR